MDMTSTSAAVATVFAAFAGVLAMIAVLAYASWGSGQRPCEGRRKREETARIAQAQEILGNESIIVSEETIVAIIAQRQAPSESART